MLQGDSVNVRHRNVIIANKFPVGAALLACVVHRDWMNEWSAEQRYVTRLTRSPLHRIPCMQ